MPFTVVRAWFGHYLKDDPAPSWITEGQTWLDRKRELEDFEKAKKSKKPNKPTEGKNRDG